MGVPDWDLGLKGCFATRATVTGRGIHATTWRRPSAVCVAGEAEEPYLAPTNQVRGDNHPPSGKRGPRSHRPQLTGSFPFARTLLSKHALK